MIWGDWTDQGKGRSGILEMMDIADSHDVKFSFYLDIAEYDQYGEEIIEAGKSILERGHDLQMHLHPKFLNENTWKEIGFPKPDYSHTVFSDEMSKNMIIHQVQRFNDLFGMLPDSYRGGSFNINRGDIEGLKQMNVKNSSNHAYGSYLKKGKKPLAELYQKLFKYENGVTELGISDIPVNGGYWGLTFPN